ncbi:hypothetical protein ADEAN_000590300 [Angomonas deanei]|uniref:Uncharacterized protein n=1 Tax=Angomonas deanei TaxID=59799 RepID=A0A7G2CGC9_9TRYP|nr:hypothetical protein ADEAN_000590300 [Angomonas deanei]
MFQLESVLLLALDVVRGPYIHCCAPKGVTDSVHMLFQDVSAMNNNQNVKSPTSPASTKFKTTHTSNNNIIHSSSDTHPSPDSKTSRVDPNRPQSNLFISGRYNNVLVPRGEFCRRALWLYSAESGQLLLYYAEDIAGERYARKNLRYSVCFVCKVADKMTTVDDRFIREHIQPYGTLLTVIAEELRDAEVRYGYVSRELHQQRSHSPPSSKTEESTRDLETEAELDPQFPSSSHTGKHLNHFVTSPHTTNWVPLERFFLSLPRVHPPSSEQ